MGTSCHYKKVKPLRYGYCQHQITYSGFKITSSLKNEQLCMHLYQKENLKTMFIMEDWLLPLL